MAFDVTPLNASVSIVDSQGRPSQQFQIWWQNFIRSLTAEFGALEAAQAAQNAADAANAAAEAAQTSADNADAAASGAQTAADAAARASSLATSGVSGMTMTATDAGASVTIAISAHTRIYGDGTSVAVNAGNLTGRAYSTDYYIYYIDPARAGGAVTYQSSTNPDDAVQAGDTHSLGAVRTPAAAGAPTNGNPNLPPGVQEP